MITLRCLLTLMIAAGLLFLATTVCARTSGPYSINPALTSSLEADGLHLRIGFDNNGFGNVVWVRTPYGVDLYRRTVGVQCGDAQRITDTPIPWTWNDQAYFPEFSMEIAFVDVTTAENTGYRYELRAVDADRNPIPEDPDAVAGLATNGEPLLGHGSIIAGPDCGLSYTQEVMTCVDECFPWVLAGTSDELSQYVNTGTSLLLYGRIVGVSRFFCNTTVSVAFFTRAQPSLCAVGVAAVPWTAAKRLYRRNARPTAT